MADNQDAIEQKYSYLSPQSNLQVRLDKFFDKVADSEGTAWIDVFDPRYRKVTELPRTLDFEYSRAYPITTQSQNVYGTVSLWWLLVSCSGYLHPVQIPNKERFYIVSPELLYSYINRNVYQGNAGKLVRI